MATRIVALHGFSMNGSVLREPLAAALPGREILVPDAPHVCPDDAVDRLYTVWNVPRQSPPHYMWFDGTDDGRQYRGWEATQEFLRPIVADGPVGVIGFSQGALVATALAALGAHGQMPPIAWTILIGGRPPRSDLLKPYLSTPIEVPSLHIWGEADALVEDAPQALIDLYAPATREVVRWPGAHSIPTRGSGRAAMERFIARLG